ncbi:nicotinate phosphoribosyltransferase [Azotobacter vinelandii CA]|uniref:Nicotinate phosphoribosyltransferase n=2 Tax=Azotobacter vinelandii TaxID=354 RepID=C1DHZ8_AZOVD|nr:nicotinate phosphoribosyltransferase [Azotobacter vinelandii]ACO80731.1 Nicotinate phosphoribosyltransferase related protein [Azotobacter vinelandii DJ]AGK12627.1 nicotinate phosphoribosyltransferase [Azotobacter vinelandii CA]AGK22111.1 nicotinate phosphoribosyltransferase [Azotobacter vinelandii CA6]WKN21534.1 nicotinate phosphoribosyltransferase [Azotobacter vinelandii]SFX04918.1 nicotinate phosphoribosyltransferase [Azotobacter vinelandii]
MPHDPPYLPAPGALLTDLYQLTMLQGYVERDMLDGAVFEFFARKPPACRNFYLAAGLEQVLDYLEQLHFTQGELDWLSGLGLFRPAFLDYLAGLRFSGEVQAMAEGTPFFADEPILRVVAPLPEAQLVESRLINLLHFQTLIASKAARLTLAASGRRLVDFGLRRAHGAEAGLLAARASYLAGFQASATVLAGAQFGIPLAGTMAHSFVQAHLDEAEAFEHFARSLPQSVLLLIDTYDTEAAARKVVELAPRLAAAGIRVQGVRLDSGDLGEHARRVRAILDRGGLGDATVFASGNLDEYEVRRLLAEGAPIDGFGVGTRLDTSSDAPYLDCVYKLQEYAGQPRRKRSEGKATWPGRKQVWRRYDDDGRCRGDSLMLEGETGEGQALIRPVMRDGRRLAPSPSLREVRAHALRQLDTLPAALRALEPAPPYPVAVSEALRDLAERADRLAGL